MENISQENLETKQSLVFHPCKVCGKQFEISELLVSEKLEFCREHFADGTIVIGLMNWNKEHPEYKHPLMPKIPIDATFDQVYKVYKVCVLESTNYFPEQE